LHRKRRSQLFFLRRIYHRLFSPARQLRKRAILKDFEEELIDRTHRTFLNQIRRRIVLRTAVLFFCILFIGALAPNFLDFQSSPLGVDEALASYEEDYGQNILLSVDGYLTKTYMPTEESKGANGVFTVKVQPGDTLSTIASRYGVSVRDIIINNSLPSNPILSLGEKLIIANGIIHEVAKGDTLDSIAKIYGVEKDHILAANSLVEKDLHAGMKIVIAGAKNVLPTFATRSSGKARVYANNIALQMPAGSGKLLFPTIGQYTQYFHPGHYAVDVANNQSPDIVAAETGVVEKSQCGWNGGYGCYVVLSHGNGLKTLYGHMRKIYVTVGEQISRGQSVGQMGNTGNVHGPTGIHLHFEVIVNGVKRNPLAFF